jgi:cytochrome c oxidase assembly factor CtaG
MSGSAADRPTGGPAHTGGVAAPTYPMPSTDLTTRARRLVICSWSVAGVVLAVLAIAVIRYLAQRDDQGTPASMAMHMSDALYRSDPGRVLHQPLLSSALFTAWQLDAIAVAVLVVAAAWYLSALSLIPARSPGQRWSWWRTSSFFAGLAVCAYATNGSFAVYDQVLFSAHMLGHLALVMFAPILIVSGRPLRLLTLAARPDTRERLHRLVTGRVVSVITAPPVALACYAVAIVGTHLTGLMDQIMRITWAGQLEHLVYLLVGCQFFALIVGDEPLRWRLSAPARWLLLAIAMAVDTFTGVILIQATSPIAMLAAPGLSINPLSDTHTGGAVMWVGGDAIMAVVMVVLVISWLYRPQQQAADRNSWTERARQSTFETHTGSVDGIELDDVGDSDAARTAYNEWLANLAKR